MGPLKNVCYALAWQNFVDRCENMRILINSQPKILLNLASIRKELRPQIKSLSWLYYSYTCVLPAFQNLWEKTQKRYSELPKWEEMDGYLSYRYYTLVL